ncbi:MAG: VIT domain-containing protein, partial [Myxococcota bacterium]|nr:VIT domain-containing protein [Myxococcota bacterium]
TSVPAGPSGRIVAVRGPAGASVEVRDGSGRRLVAPGGDLPDLAPGAELSTDARTVAVVELTDGTRITLNRDTSLALDAAEADLLRVPRGEIVADVVARAAGRAPLRIAVPTGEIAVLGTKFGLAAEDDHCRVDVARGEVEVRAKDGRSARALAGEEAILSLEGAPSVTPVRDLSDLLEWAERLDEDEKAPRGLGSLRAYPPGRPERERPLSLDSHKVTVRVQGPYARTEVEEVFRNDTGETLEGVYRFPLPPGASVARLALDVDGRMEEGAFVESDRATRIWRGVIRQATPQERRRPREEFIWVAGPWKDPALLQWRKGNQFELRIFPIEANSSRRVAIAYTEVLRPVGNHRRYVYPLPFDEGGSTKAGRFSFEARLAGIDADKPVRSLGYDVRTGTDGAAKTASFEKDDFTATGDLVLDFALPAKGAGLRAVAYRATAVDSAADGYVLLSIRPDLPARGDPKPRDVLIVADSSYSAFGDRWARQAKLVRAIVEEMDRRDRVAVIACDVACRRVGDPFGRPSSELAESVARDLTA